MIATGSPAATLPSAVGASPLSGEADKKRWGRLLLLKTQLGHEVRGPAERPSRRWSGAPVQRAIWRADTPARSLHRSAAG
jgi:hypothetical protein